MQNSIKKENLTYNDSIKINKRGETILGVLEGPCAECFTPTRNGRLYTNELWEKVWNDPIIDEYFESGGILGELDHPLDGRLEIDTSKVAICMPEKPKKNEKGQYIARFDILDTPNGRIAATLAKYGYKLGISSRGDGEIEEDFNGNESVNPDTYDFKAFDLVLLPAVKSARLKMVESLQKPFKQALTEALNKSNTDERKVMEETLERLNINYKENLTENAKQQPDEASNAGTEVNVLQEVLKENKKLKQDLMELQEKISVCNAKEIKQLEELERYKSFAIRLSESSKTIKALNSKIKNLEEQLNNKDKNFQAVSSKLTQLSENFKNSIETKTTLTESINSKNTIIETLNCRIKTLTESLESNEKKSKDNIKVLQENIEALKKNSLIIKNNFESKLNTSKTLTEKYKSIAKSVVEEYIKQKAIMIGVTPNEIKNRLNENYSINDINNVCENLQEYALNLGALPIVGLPKDKKIKMNIKESLNSDKPANPAYDDTVDENLLRLANIK